MNVDDNRGGRFYMGHRLWIIRAQALRRASTIIMLRHNDRTHMMYNNTHLLTLAMESKSL